MSETRGEIIARGNAARDLQENEVLSLAFEDVLQNISEGFLSARTSSEEVLDLHRQAIAVKAVRGTLQRYIDSAQVEEHNKRIDEDK